MPILFPTLHLAAVLALATPGQDTSFTLAAVRLPAAPEIDGLVDTAEWRGAARAGRFIQYAPRNGEPASAPTEVLVGYDSSHLFLAFLVYDREPLTARLTRRDADLFGDDDAVAVLVDTHDDRRSAYYFIANLLGTQADGRIADDGRTVDGSWDAPWRTAARVTPFGWSVEMAIPLSSMSYRAGTERTWGINFGRSRRRTLERSFWAGPLENPYRVSQAGRLTGLDLEPPRRRHLIIPYGLAKAATGESSEWDVGVDLRYGLASGMALSGTINPDFATIESDREQVNLTRFELSLPEKRVFFQEGGELFRQRIRTFYTRRIADIRGGAKLLGKQGPWTLAAIFAHGERIGDAPRPDFTVLRAQRDVLGRSNVAVTLADRGADGRHSGSVGADATVFLTRNIGFTAQLVESYGDFSTGTHAFFVRPSYDTPTGHFHVRYTELGERFADNANGIGFIRDDDRRELDSAIEKTVWFRGGPLEQFEYNSNYNAYWSRETGRLRSWEVSQSVDLEFRNRVTVELEHDQDFQRFEKDFRNHSSQVTVGYNTREYQSAEVGLQWGRNFDADFRLWSGLVRLKPTRQLSLEYELERLTLDPDPENESTWIHVGRISHAFTPDLLLRVFLQSNSVIDRREAQAVLVYRYQPPFGTLQLAFQRGSAGFGERSEQGSTFFLKATTVF